MRKSNIPFGSFDDRITQLENNETVYEIFEAFPKETTAGTVAIPAESSIFDLYEDGITDCIAVKTDAGGHPTEELVYTSTGDVISVVLNKLNGEFTLSGSSTFDYCLLYYVIIKDQYKSNIATDSIVGVINADNLDNDIHSVGVIDANVPDFTDHGDSTVTFNSCNVGLRSDPFHKSIIKSYNVPAKTLTITAEESYVCVSYNSGTPEYYIETNPYAINGSDAFIVYFIWKQGLILHSSDQDSVGLGLANKLNSRLLFTEPYKLTVFGGLLCSEVATPNPRTIVISEAVVFKGVVAENVALFDSSVDMLTKAVYTVGGWVYIRTLVYNNTTINPYTGGEVAMTGNKWKYILYYRSIGDIKETFYVLSPEEYSSEAAARTASESGRIDLPILLQHHCMLVGRSIVQNNAINGITEQFVNRVGNFTSPIPNHNDTNNKQGGTTGEYYHLTSSDYTDKILNRRFGNVSAGNYSEFEEDGTLVSRGTALTYRDEYPVILIPVSGAAAPDSVAHTVGGVARQFYSFDGVNTQEILSGSIEIPHDYAYGQPIEVHIHWRPSTIGTGYVKWFFDWEYSPPQGASLSQVSLSVIRSINNQQYYHLLDSFGNLPDVGFVLGGKIGFNIRRTPTDIQDTYAADVLIEQVAVHVPLDTLGSRQIYTK